MQITLAVIGKLKDSALKDLYEEYRKRLSWKIILHEFDSMPTSQQENNLLLDRRTDNEIKPYHPRREARNVKRRFRRK